MKNKLLISMALLAAGFAVASCEKTPSGESGADAQNQSGSATSERQSDGAAQVQQQAQEHPDQSAGQAARAANEQQSKQVQHEQAAQDRNTGDKQSQEQRDQSSAQAQDQNNKAKVGEAQQSETTQQDPANVQSPSSAQSDRAGLQQGQAQPNQSQQNQTQQNEPQQNQPQQNQPLQNPPLQNQQAGVGAAGDAVHLGPEQIRQAQMVLKQKGFDVGLADGIMGPRTRKALIAFQQQQGLQATGQIDQRTVTALGMVTGSGQQDNPGAASTTGHGGTGAQ